MELTTLAVEFQVSSTEVLVTLFVSTGCNFGALGTVTVKQTTAFHSPRQPRAPYSTPTLIKASVELEANISKKKSSTSLKGSLMSCLVHSKKLLILDSRIRSVEFYKRQHTFEHAVSYRKRDSLISSPVVNCGISLRA